MKYINEKIYFGNANRCTPTGFKKVLWLSLSVFIATFFGIGDTTAQIAQRIHQNDKATSSQSNTPAATTNLFSIPNPNTAGASRRRVKVRLAPKPATIFGRAASEVSSSLDPLTESFDSSVVELETEYGRQSTGTIISTESGLIIGKRSELVGTIYCKIGTQKSKCRLLAFHRVNDLALLAIQPSNLNGQTQINIPDILDPVSSGKMVVSIAKHGLPSKLGIVSILPTPFEVAQPKRNEGVDLGAPVSRWAVSRPFQTDYGTQFNSGLEVQRVYPQSIAERAGLLKGDLLQSVNGVRLSSQSELKIVADKLRVGQEVVFDAIRDGKSKRLSKYRE